MEQNLVEQSLPTVPTEPVITREEPFTEQIEYTIQCSPGKNISIKRPLAVLLGDELYGMGKVDVHSITLIYQCTAAGQYVNFGLANANSNLTATQVAMSLNGHSFTSNAMNYGSQTTVELMVPDVLTRQIQPASSHLPTFKLYLSAHARVKLVLVFRLKRYGPRIVRQVFQL
jgi:hypothetical protein